jgi:hypothetical protein
MAVNDVWLYAAKHAEEAHSGAGNRALANDVDMKAFRAKHFEQRPQTGIDADRDVVPIGALHTAELDNKYLRTPHLKTVDNVNDFHWVGEVVTAGEKVYGRSSYYRIYRKLPDRKTHHSAGIFSGVLGSGAEA